MPSSPLDLSDTRAFQVHDDRVFWITEYGPATLSPDTVERLLGVWQLIDEPPAHRLYNRLHDAASQTSWFIQRVSSLRDRRAA